MLGPYIYDVRTDSTMLLIGCVIQALTREGREANDPEIKVKSLIF